jgi:biopolymer transport protein ExbB/TolQ
MDKKVYKISRYFSDSAVNSGAENSSNSGGVLAPALIGLGAGQMYLGKRSLDKAKRQSESATRLNDIAQKIDKKGKKAVEELKSSRINRWFRRNKIREAEEKAAEATESALRRVRRVSRSAKFNRLKGKGLLGTGMAVAGIGTYKLLKNKDKNK